MSAYLSWPVILCLVTGFGTLFLVWYLLKYRDKPGATWFAVSMVAQAAFVFIYAIGLTVFDPDLRWWFEVGSLIALSWIGIPFLGFALEYTGRGSLRKSWLYWSLYAFPVGTTILLPLNPDGLFWTDFAVDPVFGVAAASYDMGPLMYVAILVGTGLSTVGVLLLVEAVWDYGALFRSEALAVVLSPVLPAIGLLVWLFQLTPNAHLNWTAPLFAGHVLFDLYAFVGREMFETHPATNRAAKESAIEEFRSPVLVLEEEGRVVEMNPAAREQLDLDRDETILEPISAVVDSLNGTGWDSHRTVEQYLKDEDDWRLSVRNGPQRKEYVVQPSPLTAGGERVGYTLLFTEVTEEIQREERLSVLNRILRHNLRNDLSIVSGYVSAADNQTEDELVEQMLGKVSATVDELIETGEMAREFEKLIAEPEEYTRSVNVETLLDDLRDRLAAEHPEVTLSTETPTTSVQTNPDVLRAVLWQLLDNAAVHNDSDTPSVSIRAHETETRTVIEITDDGPGIPDHELRSLQHGQETSLDHGSGFGLWLAKWGSVRIGGRVEFEADESGTTARVSLPRDSGDGSVQASSASA